MPPATKPTAPPPQLPNDGLLHESVPADPADKSTLRHVTKCGSTTPLSSVFPRAAFLRQARKRDPKAEADKRVPAGVCPSCWPGLGLIIRAPKTGKGSVQALIRNAKKAAEAARKP